jgi:hypothetical protein
VLEHKLNTLNEMDVSELNSTNKKLQFNYIGHMIDKSWTLYDCIVIGFKASTIISTSLAMSILLLF